MKNVAIFRNELLPHSETFIKEQARFLVNWHPTFIGYRSVPDGIDLQNFNTRIIRGSMPETFERYRLRLRQLLDRPHRATVDALRESGASLVHAHFGTDATDIWPSVKAAGLPMIVTLHGYDINTYREWWEAGHGGIHRRAYPGRLMRMAQEPKVHFIAVSRAIKQRAIESGIPEQKLNICPIGVDTKRFKPGDQPITQRRKRILFVGRLVEKKAPLLMVRAFADVLEHIPNAELAIIGNGPLMEATRQLASSLNAPVQFLGAQGTDAIITEMHKAQVFCLPSVTARNGDMEGLPISVLEAMACGTVVVTSASGAINEAVIHESSGICFKENDKKNLCEILRNLLSNDKTLKAISRAGRERAEEKFSIVAKTKDLENFYSSL